MCGKDSGFLWKIEKSTSLVGDNFQKDWRYNRHNPPNAATIPVESTTWHVGEHRRKKHGIYKPGNLCRINFILNLKFVSASIYGLHQHRSLFAQLLHTFLRRISGGAKELLLQVIPELLRTDTRKLFCRFSWLISAPLSLTHIREEVLVKRYRKDRFKVTSTQICGFFSAKNEAIQSCITFANLFDSCVYVFLYGSR